jgi:ABC-type glycerol-3-phosphate transport system substrate-binding protein
MLDTPAPISEDTLEKACTLPVTRRQLLRTMAAGSVALVGGAALAACSSGSGTSAVKVTFYSSAWPGDSMPTAAQIKSSPVTKAYADSLTKWLKQNPGITIKHSATNIWDTQILTTAVSAGTAPTWYMGNVLGSFLDPAVRAALTRGLAADLTDLIAKNNLEAQLTSNYLPVFRNTQVGGKYYGTPAGYGIGHGIYFRRDLLQQYGLQEPQPGWTWEDFRTLAKQMTRGKMHGAQMQSYIFSEALYSNGLVSSAISMGSLGLTPSSSSTYPWRFDLNSIANRYEAVVNNWRAMIYTDKSILINKNYGDSDIAAAFIRGDIALASSDVSFLTSSPSATNTTSAQALTNRLNKPIDDVLGFVPNPGGPHGSFGATQAGGAIGSIDPKLQRNPGALATAYDFLTYMIIGQGAVDQIYEQYQDTKDLKLVYNSASPMTKNMTTFPNISGTAADAWGPKTFKAFQTIASIPLIPSYTSYFPAEQNTLPTEDAVNDALNGLNFTQNPVAPILAKLQTAQNQQYSSLNSSIVKADFLKSAQTFYKVLDAFWQTNAPDFYAQDFHPWYEQTILPAIGG